MELSCPGSLENTSCRKHTFPLRLAQAWAGSLRRLTVLQIQTCPQEIPSAFLGANLERFFTGIPFFTLPWIIPDLPTLLTKAICRLTASRILYNRWASPWNRMLMSLAFYLLQILLLFVFTYFFKILFIFNWRIIALQYCVGFCHIPMWISHRYLYVPSLLNLPPTSNPIPPSRLSRSTCLSAPS